MSRITNSRQHQAIVFRKEVGESLDLDYIITTEGRVVKSSNGLTDEYTYEYHIKDHLGNTRVAYHPAETGPEVDQISDYYPFGMQHKPLAENNDNKYLYNGKELIEELGWYDYGMRYYDPNLGRFSTIDLLAEDYSFQSPYVYSINNPIRYVDFMGMGPFDAISEFCNDVTSAVQDFADGVALAVDDAVSAVGDAVEAVGEAVKEVGEILGQDFSGNDTFETGSTDRFTSKNGGGNENATSTHPDEVKSENIDDLLSTKPTAGSLNSSILNLASSASKASSIVKEVNSNKENNKGESSEVMSTSTGNGFRTGWGSGPNSEGVTFHKDSSHTNGTVTFTKRVNGKFVPSNRSEFEENYK